MKKSLLTLFALAAMSATALAADIKPAIVYGTGGKFDKSFNEAAYNGAEKFKKETGIAYRDFEPTGDTQGEQALRNFASKGFNPVIAVSFAWTSALQKVAAEYPKTEFVLIDDSLDLPNVRSVKFKENEGSYLAGHGCAVFEERQGRLRRRHGHPADPQVRVWLRAGRTRRQPEDRSIPEHDRHDGRCLE
jgi:basic membrane protein A